MAHPFVFALVLGLGIALLAAPESSAEDAGSHSGFSAEDLLPLSARRALFVLRLADGETSEVQWSRLPVAGSESRWRIEAVGHQATVLERGEDGRLQIVTQWDYRKGHRIDYEPPALLLPARLEPGVVGHSESRVTIQDLDGGGTKTGTCVHDVRLVGENMVDTPGGAFHSVRVDVTRNVDVMVADAKVVIELAFVLQRGRVLERTVQRISLFGFGGARKRSSLELLAEGDVEKAGSLGGD